MSLTNKEEYNEEPVCYCKNCLSLAVKELKNSGIDVCLECGNVDFEKTSIDDWIELYTKEYGEPFISGEQVDED